ncbi:MAG: GtrA family protein [Hyphomonadaceae bacterium]|nr:GtrA family protein [Hyphomonadaceae bacterium]
MSNGAETTQRRFIGFVMVGAIGFLVDGGLLMLLTAHLGPLAGRLVSFLSAVTVTFLLNRRFVFADRAASAPVHVQLYRYIAANSVGALLNLGIYTGLVLTGWPWVSQPLIAFAIASATALIVNFTLTHLIVFGKD